MDKQTMPLVLVADDEPSMLALVAQHARSMGYPVLEASDGEQAWSIAENELPDLVILDVMMPAMSGWEVCRKIRESVALAHTGVIMLTGIGENLNELTSPLYGADEFIDKPFDFAELDQKVRAVLAKRAAQRDNLPGLARTEPEPATPSDVPKQAAPAPVASAVKPAPKKPAPKKPAHKKPAPKKPAPKKPAPKKPAPKKPARKASRRAAPKKRAPARPVKKTAKRPAKKPSRRR
jgi:CheY-like chemotaxis protein